MFKFRILMSITTSCNNNCKHCYMHEDSIYENERKNALPIRDLVKILDQIEDFEKKYNVKMSDFNITGGDPLLRKDWEEFFQELQKKSDNIRVLANPESLTEKNLKKLKDFNVKEIQLSLDGLEKDHDLTRRKGSFKNTLNALNLINDFGFASSVRFTLYPSNKDSFIPLIKFLAKDTKLEKFSFAVGCAIGNARKNLTSFTPDELYEILSKYLDTKDELQKQNCKLRFNHDAHLLKLILFERGKYLPIPNPDFLLGCSTGFTPPQIGPDGGAYACKLLPINIGKLPQQSFEEVFLGNIYLKKLRRAKYYAACGNCHFYTVCRGCPSKVFANTKDPFAENPFCFIDKIKRKVNLKKIERKEPDLNTNFQQEWDFISSKYNLFDKTKYIFKEKTFQKAYLNIYNSKKNIDFFLLDPNKYLSENKLIVTDEELSWLIFSFNDSEKVHNLFRRDLFANQIKNYQIEQLIKKGSEVFNAEI
ncbi:MAG: putative mycofactocin radical SAM maturase MftC [Candidatus Anoxychlamydiales bacterium]|nr:putative mycofactocin radical SAM maturase MftC [Candidatus Anoxychlamydiales bacterium]